jgi:hypothetical protein
MSFVRLAQLIAAVGVLSLTACAADSATAPGTMRAASAPARDLTCANGYIQADGRCK